MKTKYILYTAVLSLFVLLCCSCGITPDQVKDPLSDFDVEAEIPFATKAAVSPTPSPTQAPIITAAPTAQGISWQEIPGTYTSAPTRKPTPVPTVYVYTTPGPREEELSVGSEGNNVYLLQKRLTALGYYSSNCDGIFGSKTKAAVLLFQETMGIMATGTADLYTLKVLYADIKTYSQMISSGSVTYSATPVPSTITGYELLQDGSTGSAVIKLQQRLIQLGYLDTKADGDYGSVTAKAVSLFQEALGWEKTGIATSALQSYLFASTAPYYNGSQPASYPTSAPAAVSYTTLSPGDTGTAVKKLQARLKELGYFNSDASGNYLAKTTDAVKLFQAALGWEQTGVATASLQAKLYASDAPDYTAPTKAPASTPAANTSIVIQYGDSGEHVTRIQNRLKALGYFSGDPTGNYYGQTESAVMLFQEQLGLKKTGIVDKALWKALFAESAPSYENIEFYEEVDGSTVVLKPGDTGSKVSKLQQALHDLGYFNDEVSGNYLSATTTAVKRAQKMMNYKIDGSATYALLERIMDNSAPTLEECRSYSLLKVGDKSDSVAKLQQRLIELGFFNNYSSSHKGKFTYATLEACKEVQRMRGLNSIDDFASAEFQAYLFSDAAYYHSYSYIEE